MKPLPLLISVPHAGTEIPKEVKHLNLLSQAEIDADRDVGASEIYDFSDRVACYVTTPIARAFVDMNRSPTDIRKDGVVKTHTCWDVPIYLKPLSTQITQSLIENYHKPYHEKLSQKSKESVILGIDCHTMAENGPPVGPDPGKRRPLICLSLVESSFPEGWATSLPKAFEGVFGSNVQINDPFKGGYITHQHSKEIPWIQLEFSRTKTISNKDKRAGLIRVLKTWCSDHA